MTSTMLAVPTCRMRHCTLSSVAISALTRMPWLRMSVGLTGWFRSSTTSMAPVGQT